VKSIERVQRALMGDRRTAADRVLSTGPAPDSVAQALQQLRRRGEAQLGQSSPTIVWRKQSDR
jgi:hypothetical protein